MLLIYCGFALPKNPYDAAALHMCVCMYACMHVCMYLRACVRACMHVYMHITYIHAPSDANRRGPT